MSCMLRISGVKLDIDRLLSEVPLRPTMSFRKGEPRFSNRPRGKKHSRSGASFAVSDAEFTQFEKQKKDAMAFLKTKGAVIRKMMKWPGLDAGGLDFGVQRRDVLVQCDEFPAELLKLAGGLGLSIELSCYPAPEMTRKRRKPTKRAGPPRRP